MKKYEINTYIDHAVLKPEMTQEKLRMPFNWGYTIRLNCMCKTQILS